VFAYIGYHGGMTRKDLTDAQWARLAAVLPPQKPPKAGKPNLDHRPIVNGILWRLRTGAPWRDLPERYGKWQTVYSRFRRWRLSGVWDRALAALQSQAQTAGEIDWSLHFVDGTTIRAHQHAAGAKKGAAIKPLDEVEGGSAPSSTCGLSAAASRSW
jgi:transposase